MSSLIIPFVSKTKKIMGKIVELVFGGAVALFISGTTLILEIGYICITPSLWNRDSLYREFRMNKWIVS